MPTNHHLMLGITCGNSFFLAKAHSLVSSIIKGSVYPTLIFLCYFIIFVSSLLLSHSKIYICLNCVCVCVCVCMLDVVVLLIDIFIVP